MALDETEIRRILEQLDEEEDVPQTRNVENDIDGSDIEGENEVLEVNEYDSGSEVSVDDAEEMDIDRKDEEFFFYIGKDNETIWSSRPPVEAATRVPAENIIKVSPGPTRICRDTSKPIDAFLKFIDLGIIDTIVDCTNFFIATKREQVGYSRDRDDKDTTRDEIMAVFGILYLLGVNHRNHANCRELWKDDGTGMMITRATFSYTRFLFLLRSIRFDILSTRVVREETDKLAAIRQVYSIFLTNCRNNYTHGEFTTIDEMLFAFRGQCEFVQYMTNKASKYGIKFYSLCDSKTFYTSNFEIYCGKQKPGIHDVSNEPYNIVQRLSEDIQRSNRNITMDSYYTSVSLADDLLEKGLTSTGTLKANTKEIPSEFISKSSEIGSCLYGFQYDKTLVSMQTKRRKRVLVLSTRHCCEGNDDETKEPLIITDYNSTKCGVDTVNKMCASYSTARQTRRWPLRIFFCFLDLAGINSQVVFYHNNNSTKRRREYLSDLGCELLEAHLKVRAQISTLPNDIQFFLRKYRNELQPLDVPEIEKSAGPCYVCGGRKCNRTTVKCKYCKKFVCKKHSKHMATCEKCL